MRFVLTLVLLFSSLSLFAQNDAKRQEWMKEMQQVKNEYIAKSLALTEEQKAKFFPLYERMDKEVRKVSEDARKMARDVQAKGDKATDLEYEKAAEALYEVKGRESQVEMKYFAEFKKILTPKQLYKLKDAERDFTKQLMKKHRDQRHGKK